MIKNIKGGDLGVRWLVFKLKIYLLTLFVLALSLYAYIFASSMSTNKNLVTGIEAVALGMIPACLVGLLWEVFIKKEFVQYIQNEMNFCDQINTIGIKGIYSKRDEIDLVNSIKNAKQRIWILLTWLSYLTETSIQDELIKKGKNGKIDIRILGLNPESKAVELRSKSPIYEDLKTEIPNYLKKLTNSLKREKIDNFQVKTYDDSPTVACFIIDDNLYFCPLLHSNRGRNCVHFLVSNSIDHECQLFEELEKHFLYLFTNEDSILIYP